MKRINCFVVAGLLIILGSCSKPNINVKLVSPVDTISYYIGILTAKNLQGNTGVENINPRAIAMGFEKVFSKDSIKVTDMEMQRRLQSYFSELQKINGEKSLKEGQEFLEKNKKNPGIVTLPDGLEYTVIKDGNGAKPDSGDVVNVNYIGSNIDGKEFENSLKMGGAPVKIPIGRTVKGFSEALLKMKVGSKWKLFIPADLGYGSRGNQRIKPNSVLIFEIELLSIEPKVAAPAKKK
jgi:FKBP-type peptidyl-prolyl cis-trans isomerase FklB